MASSDTAGSGQHHCEALTTFPSCSHSHNWRRLHSHRSVTGEGRKGGSAAAGGALSAQDGAPFLLYCNNVVSMRPPAASHVAALRNGKTAPPLGLYPRRPYRVRWYSHGGDAAQCLVDCNPGQQRRQKRFAAEHGPGLKASTQVAARHLHRL